MAIPISVPGNLGNIEGAASDGVLAGQLTPANPGKVLLKTHAQAVLCITDDGGLYVNETTPANNATADDVEIVGSTLDVGDAIYVGHATKTFSKIDFLIGIQGAYTTTTFTKKYWNGTAWTALSGVTDGTTNFTAAVGTRQVSYTIPTDWQKCLVDGVNGYWVQIECDATAGTTTPCEITQIWVIAPSASATWTDDTADFISAGASDVAALPAHAVVGDGLYVGYSEKFCKLKVTVGTARTGTATLALKYWNGTSYAAFPAGTIDDDSAGWSTGTSTYFVHFIPPADWVANTAGNGPNGEAGYFVVMEATAITSVTVVPLLTQGWVLPLKTGASGINLRERSRLIDVTASAGTASAANANSVFLVLNCTTGEFDTFTWTKADPNVSEELNLLCSVSDDLALIQITEDGTTEFADASFSLSLVA
jgi:hypothetical protein